VAVAVVAVAVVAVVAVVVVAAVVVMVVVAVARNSSTDLTLNLSPHPPDSAPNLILTPSP